MQDSGHFHHILKKPGQHTETKIILVTFKRQKRPVGQRSQIFPYKPKTFADTVSLISRAWDMKRCVPQVSRAGTLSGQGGKGAFSHAAAEQIYPVFSPLNQEDLSQNASVACSCSSITRETEQSIKQRGTKIQDLMPRIYFSLPRKAADTGQVLQHQW